MRALGPRVDILVCRIVAMRRYPCASEVGNIHLSSVECLIENKLPCANRTL